MRVKRLLMIYAEAVYHAFRPFKPIDGEVMAIHIEFLVRPAAVDFSPATDGIGQVFALSSEITDARDEPELRDAVRRRFVSAFRYYLPDEPRKDDIVAAVDASLKSPPPYRATLFHLHGRPDQLSVIYRYGIDASAIEIVDAGDRVLGTLVSHDRFVSTYHLISATQGTVRGGVARLYDGSRRLVAEVPLEL